MKAIRLSIVLTVVLLVVGLLAPMALAGEYAPGKGYNDAPTHANSECVYNGHDDEDPEDDGLWALSPAKGKVQSGGQLQAIKAQGIEVPPDYAAFIPPINGVQRFACNGHTAPLK